MNHELNHPIDLGKNIYYMSAGELYADKIISRSHIENLDGTDDWEYKCNRTIFRTADVDGDIYLSLSALIENMTIEDNRDGDIICMSIKEFNTK